MRDSVYSNHDFVEMRDRINKEFKRRSTYSWNGPMTVPTVGSDKTPPIITYYVGGTTIEAPLSDESYTINNPSYKSVYPSRNIEIGVPYWIEDSNLHTAVMNDSNIYRDDFEPDENGNLTEGLEEDHLYLTVENENGLLDRHEQVASGYHFNTEYNHLIARTTIGDNPTNASKYDYPLGSDARWTLDEVKNYLVGLARMNDVPLFYGLDEEVGLAFRDPKKIEETITAAENAKLNELKVDEEGNQVTYESGESDGEEINEVVKKLDSNNFFDDYGISPGKSFTTKLTMDETIETDNSNLFEMYINNNDELCIRVHGIYIKDIDHFEINNDGYLVVHYTDNSSETIDTILHGYQLEINDNGELLVTEPYYYFETNDRNEYNIKNPGKTQLVRRDQINQNNERQNVNTIIFEGGTQYNELNPRNPIAGSSYESRPVYTGIQTSTCAGACTGLCSNTCDNECSESCSSTCYGVCGNACTAECGQNCTQECVLSCQQSCSTGCKDTGGHACVNSGAQAIDMSVSGGSNGENPSINVSIKTYSCDGCSYSCQFYPNKKTTCWDSGCMSQCFTSCDTGCMKSCTGECIGQDSESGGTGCMNHCTMNCSNSCSDTCETYCIYTCFTECINACFDNCMYGCETNCGVSCSTGCTETCSGCSSMCEGSCAGVGESRKCIGCSSYGGCASECMFGCNNNCLSSGCSSQCGSNNGTSCDSNCSDSCISASCTSQCSDQCTDQCSSCVNTCGWQCGPCSSNCASSCTEECNILCTQECANSCEVSCLSSCVEDCNGCTNLCYSCTAMCVGICSFKCEVTCTNCSYQCSAHCDISCSYSCMSDCNENCHTGCNTSCILTATNRTVAKYRLIGGENSSDE